MAFKEATEAYTQRLYVTEFVIFVIAEHFLLFLKNSVADAVPDKPRWVQTLLNRYEWLVGKVFLLGLGFPWVQSWPLRRAWVRVHVPIFCEVPNPPPCPNDYTVSLRRFT